MRRDGLVGGYASPVFRRQGFVELGAFVVLAIGLTIAVITAIEALEPWLPQAVARYMRNPASGLTVFIPCVFIAMAVIKAWSRSHPGRSPRG